MINLLKLYDKTPEQCAILRTESDYSFNGTYNWQRAGMKDLLDAITERYSTFTRFVDLLNAAGNYRPTIRCTKRMNEHATRRELTELKLLADSYDYFQGVRGDARRAFRG
jgi:hypothetical protein